MSNLEEMEEEEINGRIDEIDVEIKDILTKHRAFECSLLDNKPSTENEDAQNEIDIAFEEIGHALRGLIEATKTLIVNKLGLEAELNDREEAEHERQETHGKEEL